MIVSYLSKLRIADDPLDGTTAEVRAEVWSVAGNGAFGEVMRLEHQSTTRLALPGSKRDRNPPYVGFN